MKFQGHPGLLGSQPQELGAEAVKGHDRQALGGQQLLQITPLAVKVAQNFLGQVGEALFPGVLRRRLIFGPEVFHHPGAQLARGLAGKGQGQEFLRGFHPGQQGEEASQQHRGLAGTRRGLQVEAGLGI